MPERISMINAAYRFDLDEPSYLRNLGQTALPFFNNDEFLISYYMSFNADVTLSDAEVVRGDERIVEVQRALFQRQTAAIEVKEFLMATPSVFESGLQYKEIKPGMSASAELGINDFVGLTCNTQEGSLLSVGAPRREISPLARSQKERMKPVAEHLAAAWRLRLRLLSPEPITAQDAILDPEGRVLHAQGYAQNISARDALRRVVIQREQQRSQSYQQSTKSESTFWPELIQGKWTLLDRVEADGKRYIIAHRNSPKVSPLHALSFSEQKLLSLAGKGLSNKQIAVSINRSEAFVSRVLHRCVQKLGAESIVELARLSGAEPHSSGLAFGDEQLTVLGVSPQSFAAIEKLSAAEREIAADMMRGLSNQEIAARRQRTLRTVVNQIASIFTKLNISSRRGLLARLRSE